MNVKNFPDTWMYHYIRPKSDASLPHINKLTLDAFRGQLDYLARVTKILRPEEFLRFLKESSFPKNCSLLTFDDGLIDHYKWVLPELTKRKISAFFFICTFPFLEKKFTCVHKLHFLYGKLGFTRLIAEFNRLAAPLAKCLPKAKLRLFYPYDSAEVAGFKYRINYLMPQKEAERALGRIFEMFFDEKKELGKFYMGKEQLIVLKGEGMYIGMHGHSHNIFSRMGRLSLSRELRMSAAFFRRELKIEEHILSFPFGDNAAVRPSQFPLLKTAGIKYAFFAQDTARIGNFTLPRRDCRQLNYSGA